MKTDPTTTPETWYPLTVPMTFPALVQCSNGNCEILNTPDERVLNSVRWQRFFRPELPKPDAFKQWCESRNLKFFGETHLGSDIWQAATAAERSRFAEGVERILRAHDVDVPLQFLRDLRALAKGDK